MKKVALLILLLIVASTLIAAVPIGTVSSRQGDGSDFDTYTSGQGPLALCYDKVKKKWVPCSGRVKYKYPGQGEPRMEKVSYFQYFAEGRLGWASSTCKQAVVWKTNCYVRYYCVKTYKLPIGCNYRYQY